MSQDHTKASNPRVAALERRIERLEGLAGVKATEPKPRVSVRQFEDASGLAFALDPNYSDIFVLIEDEDGDAIAVDKASLGRFAEWLLANHNLNSK